MVQILPNNLLERISNEAVVSWLKHNLEILFERLRKITRNVSLDNAAADYYYCDTRDTRDTLCLRAISTDISLLPGHFAVVLSSLLFIFLYLLFLWSVQLCLSDWARAA